MLKLTKFLLLLTLVAFMSSCADDDAMPEEDLLGTWTVKSFEVDIESSTTFDGMTTTNSSAIVGSDLGYDLTLEAATFTTTGNYDISITTTSGGTTLPVNRSSYTDVSGNGTYTNDETTITIIGSFFDFDFNGQSFNSVGEAQTANYEINGDGDLVLTQNETTESSAGGATSTVVMSSTSVWEKQ